MFKLTNIQKPFVLMPGSFLKLSVNAFQRSNKLIALFFSVLFFYSCGSSDRDNDGVADERDKCPDVFARTKDGCPVEREISNIHFYIDNSASMAGYFTNKTQFNAIIADLTAKIDKQIKPIDIFFIADSTVKYAKPVQDFGDDIAQTPPANQKSSQLNKMLRDMAANNDSNDVSLLVSDCILSFPDAAIKANREINKEKAESSLKSDIYKAFYDLKKENIATSVYAFTSAFYGTYYNYQNTKTQLKGESRPFYIWVIANKELLPEFNASLHDISSFKPEESLDFGLTEKPVTKYNVISQIGREGEWNWNKSDSTIADINLKKSEQAFCVALQLSGLPLYAQSVDYLQKNMIADAKGCEISFDVKDKASPDKSKLKSTSQKQMFEEANRFIIFKITAMNLPNASVHVTMPQQYDTWYKNWSAMDDKNADAIQNKTFAFDYLITGVKEAYENKNKNYIDFSIRLKQ